MSDRDMVKVLVILLFCGAIYLFVPTESGHQNLKIDSGLDDRFECAPISAKMEECALKKGRHFSTDLADFNLWVYVRNALPDYQYVEGIMKLYWQCRRGVEQEECENGSAKVLWGESLTDSHDLVLQYPASSPELEIIWDASQNNLACVRIIASGEELPPRARITL